MTCPRCGAVVQPGAEYCPSCGAQTAQGAAPSPAPPPAPSPYQQPWPQQPYAPPPYPYPYPPPQPYLAPRDETSSLGKVIVIVVVLLVVFIAIGAVIFFMFIASVEDIVDDMPGTATVTLRAPSLEQRLVNGTWYYDVTYVVNTVSQTVSDIGWDEVLVSLDAATGATLLASATPIVNSPPDYDDASDGVVEVQAWYADADRDGAVSSGDTLKLTGLTTAAQGGQVEMRWDFSVIASAPLPSDF